MTPRPPLTATPWLWALLLAGAVLLASAVLAPIPSRAQGGPPPGPEEDWDDDDDEPPAPDEARRKEIMERIRVVRALKLKEALELDEPTARKLFEILDRYDQRFMEARHNQRQAQRALRRAMKGDATDAQIEALLQKVLDGHKALDALRYEQFEAASAVLNPRQRVRLLVALPRLEREIRKMIHEVRREHKGEERRRRGPRRRGP